MKEINQTGNERNDSPLQRPKVNLHIRFSNKNFAQDKISIEGEKRLAALPPGVLAWLQKQESALTDWMRKDQKNTLLFFHDPVRALQTAFPDIEPAVIKAIQQQRQNTSFHDTVSPAVDLNRLTVSVEKD